MRLRYGKFEGRYLEWLLLQEADYVFWMLTDENAKGLLNLVEPEVRKLIGRFDTAPIIEQCQEPRCKNLATWCNVNWNKERLLWWCDDCQPPSTEQPNETEEVIETYEDVLEYAKKYCNGSKLVVKALIRELAKGKGYADEGKEGDAVEFFT